MAMIKQSQENINGDRHVLYIVSNVNQYALSSAKAMPREA